jgi:rod shape-determining protein MreD
MRWVKFGSVVLAAAVLEAVLAGWKVKPDFMLIFLVFFSLHSGRRDAIISSFTIGFAADLIMLTGGMGPRTISFGLLGTVLSILAGAVAIRNKVVEGFVILVMGLSAGLLSQLLGLIQGQTGSGGGYAGILWTSLCSAVAGPVLFLLLGRLMRVKKEQHGM